MVTGGFTVMGGFVPEATPLKKLTSSSNDNSSQLGLFSLLFLILSTLYLPRAATDTIMLYEAIMVIEGSQIHLNYRMGSKK